MEITTIGTPEYEILMIALQTMAEVEVLQLMESNGTTFLEALNDIRTTPEEIAAVLNEPSISGTLSTEI